MGTKDFEEIIFRQGLSGDYRILINDQGINITIEEYGKSIDVNLLELDIADRFGLPGEVKVVPFGTLAFLPQYEPSLWPIRLKTEISSPPEEVVSE